MMVLASIILEKVSVPAMIADNNWCLCNWLFSDFRKRCKLYWKDNIIVCVCVFDRN